MMKGEGRGGEKRTAEGKRQAECREAYSAAAAAAALHNVEQCECPSVSPSLLPLALCPLGRLHAHAATPPTFYTLSLSRIGDTN